MFLERLREWANASEAARYTCISKVRWYQERHRNPEFAAQWEEAVKEGMETLEDEARRRAFQGVEEPVFFQGETCGHIKRYSDTLLIFLLKGAKPEKYRERMDFHADKPLLIIKDLTGGTTDD